MLKNLKKINQTWLMVFFLTVMLSACSFFNNMFSPALPEGRFMQQCDNNFHALSFSQQAFLEERERPHLDQPVLYGRGVYTLDDTLLILHYEPFPDGYESNIRYTTEDSTVDGHLFRVTLNDMATDAPIPKAVIAIQDNYGNTLQKYETDWEGLLEFRIDSVKHLRRLTVNAAYYPQVFPEIITEEGNFHEVSISLRAGSEKRTESGTDTLIIHEVSDTMLTITGPGMTEPCEYIKPGEGSRLHIRGYDRYWYD